MIFLLSCIPGDGKSPVGEMGCGMGGRWWLSCFKRIVFVFYNLILFSGCIPGDGKSPVGEIGCGMGRVVAAL